MDAAKGPRPGAAGVAAAVVVGGVALSVLRVGVQAVRQHTIVLMPDLWETLLGSQAAAVGQQFVGAWSRLGLYHPGPAWFWWAAPFVAATGDQPAGLALAASALAATAIVVGFAAARTASDGFGALVTAAVLAVGVGQLSAEGMAIPWNPTIAIVPVAAGIVCLAVAAVRGTTWPAVAAILFGTLVAQAHLGTLLLGCAIVVGAVAIWTSGYVRSGQAAPASHLAVLATAALLPWAPVAFDQARGAGNGATVLRYAATGTVDERFPAEPTGPSAQLPVRSTIRQLMSITALTHERTAVWAGVDLQTGREHEPSRWSTVVVIGLLVVAGSASRPGRWRRRPTDPLAAWICRAGLAAFAIEAAAALKIRHEFRPYLVAGAAGVGLALWLGAALVTVHAARSTAWSQELAPRTRAVVRGTATGLVIVVAAVAIGRYSHEIVGYEIEQPGDAATEDRVLAALDGGGAQLHVGGISVLQPAMTLTVHLEARGQRLAVRDRYRSHWSDLQRRASTADIDHDLWVVAAGQPLPAGCSDLGTFQRAEVCVIDRRPSTD